MSFHAVESTTLYQYPSTTQYYTSLTTGHVEFDKRATSSESGSASRSSTRRQSSSARCTDSQRCQTGSTVSGSTIALAVAIPVIVFLAIIGAFMFRSYRKGKKESESDNDPDFYGETTILPDYPSARFDQSNHPEGGTDSGLGSGGDFDNKSYYSMNPFAAENARYPSRVMQPPRRIATGQTTNRSVSNNSSHNGGGDYYNGFALPQQHQLGSSHSLNDFSKHMGSEYGAYPVGSRPASRVASPYRSPNSSDVNIHSRGARNLTEKTVSNEDPTTDSSVSYREVKEINKASVNQKDFSSVQSPLQDNVFEDANAQSFHGSPSKFAHNRQNSDLSFDYEGQDVLRRSPAKSEPRQLLSDDELEDVAKNAPKTTVDSKEGHENTDLGDEEDDESIQRMKSVYRVYFDRSDSVKTSKTIPRDEGEVPPLPELPALPNPEISIDNHVDQKGDDKEIENDEVLEANEEDDQYDTSVSRPGFQSTNSNSLLPPDSETSGKKNRPVSSIYSTVPLAQYAEQQQQNQQQYEPEHQYQQHYPQNYPPQQQYVQQHSQHRQFSPPSQSPNIYQNPGLKPKPLKPLQQLPTPSKLDDPATNTDYAPTKSLTGGSRPQDLTIKPFNPLHYSDQIFQPTSPSTATSAQFPNNAPNQSLRDVTPPSPHHIRQSVVMFNPVEIGKQKIYRPAGSFSQMNSANSSRNGSITSQTAYQDPNSSNAQLLPASGSQADLRKHLGTHEDYNIAP